MHDVSTKSRWEAWLEFFLSSVTQSCKETVAKIHALLSLQKEFRARVAAVGRSIKLLESVDLLFRTPAITIPRLMEKYDVTYRSAQLIVEKLVKAGILIERRTAFPRYYIAQEILAVINRDRD